MDGGAVFARLIRLARIVLQQPHQRLVAAIGQHDARSAQTSREYSAGSCGAGAELEEAFAADVVRDAQLPLAQLARRVPQPPAQARCRRVCGA